MLKQIRKPKPDNPRFKTPVARQIVCGACGHAREETATAPDWQCPGCGSAYNKVDPELKKVAAQRRKNERQKARTEEQELESSKKMKGNVVKTSLGLGMFALAHGTARIVTACNGLKTVIPSSPWLQLAGAAIIGAALVYAVLEFWL